MRKMFGWLALCMGLLMLYSCEIGHPKPPLVFGANVWIGYDPVYLARELDYYPKDKIHLAEYVNATEVIRAFTNGQLHVAGMTLDEALLLYQKIPDLRVILVVDYSNGADAILARAGIHSLHQLRGRRVGVENTALGAYFLSMALETAGLSPRQVDIVPLSVDEHEAAYLAHKVDAVVTFEPVRTRLVNAHARVLFDSSRLPGKIIDVIVTHDSIIRSHHDELALLIQGWDRALAFMQAEPDRAAGILAPREKMSAVEFRNLLTRVSLTDLAYNRSLYGHNLTGLQQVTREMNDYLMQRGLIQTEVDPSRLIDGMMLEELAP